MYHSFCKNTFIHLDEWTSKFELKFVGAYIHRYMYNGTNVKNARFHKICVDLLIWLIDFSLFRGSMLVLVPKNIANFNLQIGKRLKLIWSEVRVINGWYHPPEIRGRLRRHALRLFPCEQLIFRLYKNKKYLLTFNLTLKLKPNKKKLF